LRRGRVGRDRLRIRLLTVVAKTEEDGDHEEHDDEEGTAVLSATALLIRVLKLCQEMLPVLVPGTMGLQSQRQGDETASSMVNRSGEMSGNTRGPSVTAV